MAASQAKVVDCVSEDPLDALLARLMASSPQGAKDDMRTGDNSKAPTKASNVELKRCERSVEDNDPWKALSDQVNDEISRQIYDELDKQLDAQMMAELEKCQDEQCRRMDEELDRQLQEQLDAMLEASLGGDLRDDDDGNYEYYSDNDDEYYSGDEEDELENLPWSEGGEGGINSLGLGEVLAEDGALKTVSGMTFGTPKYSQEELQKMVDNLYGEGGEGKRVGPGAWGKGRWRPEGDKLDGAT